MIRGLLVPGLVAALAACTVPERLPWLRPSQPQLEAETPENGRLRPRARPGAAAPAAGARTAEQFDTTTASERAAAAAEAAPAGGETDLGVTIASLGAVGEPGFWLKTPLVTAPAKGRVEYAATGAATAVELIPLAAEPGAGSRISLAAMRLIGAPLTGLPEVRVFRVE